MYWSFTSASVPLEDSCLSLADRIPASFRNQMLCGCLFLAVVLWAGDPGVRLRAHASQGKPLQLRYPPGISADAVGVGPAFLNVHPSYHPLCGYKTSVELVFNWIFWLIVLYFSYYSRRGECTLYLLCHLGSFFLHFLCYFHTFIMGINIAKDKCALESKTLLTLV